MNKTDELSFEVLCHIGFDIGSDELDMMLEKYGLDRAQSTIQECQDALRDHVGQDRWRKGMRIVKARLQQENGNSRGNHDQGSS